MSLSEWWCDLSLIVTIGLDQRTNSRSGLVSTGMTDVFTGSIYDYTILFY